MRPLPFELPSELVGRNRPCPKVVFKTPWNSAIAGAPDHGSEWSTKSRLSSEVGIHQDDLAGTSQELLGGRRQISRGSRNYGAPRHRPSFIVLTQVITIKQPTGSSV